LEILQGTPYASPVNQRLSPAGTPVKKPPSKLVFHPFATNQLDKSHSLRLGGDKAKQKDDSAAKEKEFSALLQESLKHIFQSPINEGMQVYQDSEISTASGILSFSGHMGDWFLPWSASDYTISMGSEVPDPTPKVVPSTVSSRKIVSVDKLLAKAEKTLRRNGSVLICGGRGAGKTAILEDLSQTLSDHLIYTVHTSCGSIADSSLSVIKETLQKWFVEATFHAPSIILLDDLERLVPAELEHADSSRSRQIAEIFLHIARPALYRHRICLLASAPSSESLHSVLTNGFIFRETIALKAPDKEARRVLLESGMSEVEGLKVSEALDTLEIASMTDGYLPGDLHALIERARQEALVRCIALDETEAREVAISTADFESAVNGYVPASLRGVKLQKSTVDWNDIGGLDATRRVLLETLEWPIKYAPIFQHSKLRLRSGLLLYGYPGCGKTLLASAVAAQFGMNFISVKGPELLNKYIGASEQSVRELFERAQSARPCILFFDEFESIAPKRYFVQEMSINRSGHDSTGVTDRVVNQMLTQLDGAEGLEGVYVLAATSRPDLVDPALLRPGRLDKSLLCDIPTYDERVSILKALARKLELAADVDLDALATRTPNYTGADLQAMLYNAHLEAVHDIISEQNERPVNGDQDVPQQTFTKFKLGKNKINGSSRESLADRARTKAKVGIEET
jgi:peroxin-1